MFQSFRNQSVDLLCKSTDWFLYDGNIGRQKVKSSEKHRFSYKLDSLNIWKRNLATIFTKNMYFKRRYFSSLQIVEASNLREENPRLWNNDSLAKIFKTKPDAIEYVGSFTY